VAGAGCHPAAPAAAAAATAAPPPVRAGGSVVDDAVVATAKATSRAAAALPVRPRYVAAAPEWPSADAPTDRDDPERLV